MCWGPLPYGKAPEPCKYCGEVYCDHLTKIEDDGILIYWEDELGNGYRIEKDERNS